MPPHPQPHPRAHTHTRHHLTRTRAQSPCHRPLLPSAAQDDIAKQARFVKAIGTSADKPAAGAPAAASGKVKLSEHDGKASHIKRQEAEKARWERRKRNRASNRY